MKVKCVLVKYNSPTHSCICTHPHGLELLFSSCTYNCNFLANVPGPGFHCAKLMALLTLWRDKVSVAKRFSENFRCIIPPNKDEYHKSVLQIFCCKYQPGRDPKERWALGTNVPSNFLWSLCAKILA